MRHLGRYRLDEQLGSGAFATVWRGFDPELDSVVAVKVLAENWATNSDVCERFLVEARLLRRISHPAVVRVHDVGTACGDDGVERPYFVMDHVAGGTLASRIGALPPRDALALAVEAAEAVQVLHDEGALHRDIKPSNLLVDPARTGQRVLVADLGSVKLLADASMLTMVAGTPAYMAPEQALSSGSLDGRADVYAMGAVTYQLLSGRLPYDVDSPTEALGRPDAPPPAIAEDLGLPGKLDLVLSHALAKDPRARFETSAAFAKALRDVADGRPVVLPPRHVGGRWPASAVAVVAGLVFLVAAAVVWLVS
ncbi:MAG: serine/threonine-protein kinase [Nocardioidaceae bacterium]